MSGAGGVGAHDRTSLLRLYDGSAPQVYRYLIRMCAGDAALAEDLTQETFLVAIGRFRDGRDAEVSVPWLIGVARHKVLEHHRRVSREARRLRLVFSCDDGLARTDDRTSRHDDARSWLEDLPSEQRLALALRYVDDLSVTEVASAMGRSVRATESLLARGRRSLRRAATEVRDA